MIAKELRVSARSVERRRRAWREGGPEALHSAGPATMPKISDARFTVLEDKLGQARPPVASKIIGRPFGRVQAVIARRSPGH
ncbi:hypothetical protein [Streptomyces sp. NPDC005969]|uniref:hypothetical protein n=1 Tax=Streptomyces sp. NPDC005969 TaxID=3156722 RepID=UPI003400743F